MKAIDQLSLGWRTDLLFARFDAQVVEGPNYLTVRTPHNPTYWWGNFLLFDHPPGEGEGDVERWLSWFDAEVTRRQPESQHLAIGIDSAHAFALPAGFAAAGATLVASNVLTLRREQLRTPAKALPSGVHVRTLRLPEEAPLAAALQVAADARGLDPKGLRVFCDREMQRMGAMQAAGLGHWFGVFPSSADGEQPVAGCGLFRDGFGPHALGRFQAVDTHPRWRRQGLCTALIHAVCRHGFERMGLETLVIVADPDDVAIGLYESLGFQRGQRSWRLERYRRAPTE
jgi:RimJ/RimL family protein N-acetyltransferase